jgi:hypothetical protein
MNTIRGPLSKLLSAKVLPTFLLIVIPFGIGILMFYVSPIFQFSHNPFLFTIDSNNYTNNNENYFTFPTVFALLVAYIPGMLVLFFYNHYGLAPRYFFKSWHKYWAFWRHNPNQYFEKRGYEIAINGYDYMNLVLYAELVIVIILTLLYYVLPESIKDYSQPLLGDGFYFLQTTLIITLYATFLILIYSYARRDFRFQFAKACMNVIEIKKDEVNKIFYLMRGLNSYNKFLKRNLKLQFDNALVCSRVISSDERSQLLNLITASFKDDDKLKPVNCLSNIIHVPEGKQFLVEKQLGEKIREIMAILIALIPIVISIVQIIFPLLK